MRRLLSRVSQLRQDPEQGLSLAEMMVAILLAGLLGTILMNGFVASMRGTRHVSDDTAVQQEQQTVVERLTRDLRMARELGAATTNSKLVLWTDSNSDYSKQPGETVTWQLKTVNGKCQIIRSADDGTSKALSSSVANAGCGSPTTAADYAFTFFNSTGPLTGSGAYATATGVSISLSFRASSSSTAQTRTSVFSVRMRNVSVS